MKSKERAKLIERAIRLTWSSLDSHLELTHRKAPKFVGREKFHKTCVKDYAEMIVILTKLY